jgi:hydrogenase nickel incorporation protein HypA/HybF
MLPRRNGWLPKKRLPARQLLNRKPNYLQSENATATMHELSIAQSILEIAEKAAPPNPKTVITSVGLQVGELSGVEAEALQFALSIIKKDTVLDKAGLNIEVVKGEAECSQCRTVFAIPSFGTCCPQCSGYSMTIRKGRELRVLHIVVDE